MSKLSAWLLGAALALALGLQPVGAQVVIPGSIPPGTPPDRVLRALIEQVQTGAVDPSFIGPQLWQTIAMQTNNSGVYMQLVQLGRVTGVDVVARRDLPAGPVYSMTATHSNGTSTWLLGVSTVTRKVEYASFGINTAVTQPLPPQPEPTKPSSTSEACKKFPNLCP